SGFMLFTSACSFFGSSAQSEGVCHSCAKSLAIKLTFPFFSLDQWIEHSSPLPPPAFRCFGNGSSSNAPARHRCHPPHGILPQPRRVAVLCVLPRLPCPYL